jgi:hypothetical protein
MRGFGWWLVGAAPVLSGILWLNHLLPAYILLGVVLVCKGFLLVGASERPDSNQSPTQQRVTRPGTRAGDFWSPGGPD